MKSIVLGILLSSILRNFLQGNLGGTVDQDNATTTILDVVGIATAETSGSKAGTYTIAATNAKLN